MKLIIILLCLILSLTGVSADDRFTVDGSDVYLDRQHSARILSTIDEYVRSLVLFGDSSYEPVVRDFYTSGKTVHVNSISGVMSITMNGERYAFTRSFELVDEIMPEFNEAGLFVKNENGICSVTKKMQVYDNAPEIELVYSQTDKNGEWINTQSVKMHRTSEGMIAIYRASYDCDSDSAFVLKINRGSMTYWDNNQGANYTVRGY